jgi:hypothetical protein
VEAWACQGGQPQNLVTELWLSCLRVIVLIVLEYSGQKNNISKCFKFLVLIFDLLYFFFIVDGSAFVKFIISQ